MNASVTTMDPIRSDLQPLQTLVDFFYYWEKQQPDKVYLRQPFGDRYQDFTWGEVGRQARTLATYLQSLSLPPKSNIGLVSKNCAQWIIADIAILLSGHVSVPFYPTLTAEQLNQVLTHSGCEVLFVGKLDNWQGMKGGIPPGLRCVSFPGYNPDPDHEQWDDILRRYEPMTDSPRPGMNELFTIVYTSGTTGNPKGVMLDYKSMAAAIESTKPLLHHDVENPRFFSYLPLCHIAERNIVEATSMATGGTVYFAESLDTFGKNLAAARPTHFLAVPRIWTKFQLGVLAKMPQKKLDRLLRIPIISSLVKSKIRKGLGLNDAELILTGAAPMPTSLIKWFRRLGIHIQEAYGMTENLGAVSMMPRDAVKDGTVGRLYPGMEVMIDPTTGEVLTRADWNMVGYYREPEMTADVLRDGWLHTGDVGELDDDNYLKITGRVKEMYKTSKGEYVAPAQIEFNFADNNFIEQICVAGQSLPQPVALVVLSDLGRSADQQMVSQSLEDVVKTINPRLHSYERLHKVIVVKDPWTVDNNMMTPTMKIKRSIIEKRYEPHLPTWYEKTETVIWEG